MGSWLHHWFWDDFWTPVWPNLVASFVIYIAVYLKVNSLKRLNVQMMALHTRHHREQMQAHADLIAAVSQPGVTPPGGVVSAERGET